MSTDTTEKTRRPLYAHLRLTSSADMGTEEFPFGWWVSTSDDPDDDEDEEIDGGFHDIADEDHAEWIAKADLFLMGHGFFVHTDWTGDDMVTTAMVTQDNTASTDRKG